MGKRANKATRHRQQITSASPTQQQQVVDREPMIDQENRSILSNNM